MENEKLEAIKLWTNDPCGYAGGQNLPLGTKEFYEAIDRDRYEAYAPWMKKAMKFESYGGKSILEIGYGMGTDLFQFAKAGGQVSGVDLSPRHFEISKKRFEMYGLPADLRQADAEHMPFPDDSFDVVYSFGVLHHTPGVEKAMSEIRRVLKPGGEVIITLYHRHSAFFYFSHILTSYLLRLRFLKESYRKHMARIEHKENSDAVPLVKVYSERSLRRLLKDFNGVQIERYHLTHEHFGAFRFLIPKRWIKKFEPKLGWYIIARAVNNRPT